jgi:hypothetical protein
MNMTTGLTLGQVFSRAMQLFRDGFARLSVGILLPLALASGLMSAAITALQSGVAPGPTSAIAFFLVMLVAMAVGVVGYGALGHAAVGLAAGRDAATGDSWREGRRFRVWGTILLQGVGVILGLIFCLLPGMYLSLVWALALPVVFEESTFHSAALSRSRDLSRFNPKGGLGNDARLWIFLILTVTLATTYLLSALAQAPLMIAIILETARSVADGRRAEEMPVFIQWLQVPTTIVTSFVQSAMTLLGNLACAVVYFDIRGRQDAKDLDSAIDALDAAKGV